MKRIPRGKIGRLPKAIQEEVNRRMETGERGAELAAWLNGLPEVRAVLAARFNGQPINEVNLCQWRTRGYKDWQRWRTAQTMMAEPGAVPVAGTEPLMDQMANWAAVYYLMTVRELTQGQGEDEAGSDSKLKALREFCRDVVALQRGEYYSGRLKLDQVRLALRARGTSNNQRGTEEPRPSQ
jgi:hypothetical protein